MEDRKNALIYNASKLGINILGIVDNKICHDHTIKYARITTYIDYNIWKKFWRNQNQASAGGLGILQDSKAAEVIQWTERIMIVL